MKKDKSCSQNSQNIEIDTDLDDLTRYKMRQVLKCAPSLKPDEYQNMKAYSKYKFAGEIKPEIRKNQDDELRDNLITSS